MYSKITDPNTGKLHSINSVKGKEIIQGYLSFLKGGSNKSLEKLYKQLKKVQKKVDIIQYKINKLQFGGAGHVITPGTAENELAQKLLKSFTEDFVPKGGIDPYKEFAEMLRNEVLRGGGASVPPPPPTHEIFKIIDTFEKLPTTTVMMDGQIKIDQTLLALFIKLATYIFDWEKSY